MAWLERMTRLATAMTSFHQFLAVSKEELVALLKQGQDKRKGSQPESEISKSSSDDSGSKSSSDSSSSSSRSTPGEGEAAASQGAAGRG